MNKNIDLTKILKDCPKGTKLYSPLFGEVDFQKIRNDDECAIVVTKGVITASFTKEGFYYADLGDECILFPSKEQRSWPKFTAPWYKKEKLVEPKFHVGQYVTDGYVGGQITSIEDNYHCYKILDFMGGTNTTIPFTLQDNYHLWTIQDAKDGDVLATSAGAFIYNGNNGGGSCPGSYCGINTLGSFQTGVEHHWTSKKVYPATKEQCDALMKAMNDAGYEWDAEKKELKLLVSNQDNRDLVPDKKGKFDPKTLKPFDKVLCRANQIDTIWHCDFFSHLKNRIHICSGRVADYVVPYNEDTKHLVGTKDEAPEFYRYWED